MSDCKCQNTIHIGKVTVWKCLDCGKEEPNIKGMQEQIQEYEQLMQLQLDASVRATMMYNEKHGTDIGQMDLAKGLVFLIEENDKLQKSLRCAAVEMAQISEDFDFCSSCDKKINCHGTRKECIAYHLGKWGAK